MDLLRRDFAITEMEGLALSCGVQGTVVIQARQSTDETAYLLDVSEKHSLVRGVVGWVPLSEPHVRDWLDRFAEHPILKGMRHVLHDEPDPGYMLRDDFNRGVSLLLDYKLSYDLLIFARHLPQTIEFVDRHPAQLFVVDHIGKPGLRDRDGLRWAEDLHELARRPHVSCKISGLVTEADWEHWTEAQLEPYFNTVLEAFGPKRLMFGSDWPVLTLASSYDRWLRTVERWLQRLTASEATQIRSDTAIQFYGLNI